MNNKDNSNSAIPHSPTFNKFMRGINQIKPTARGMWSEDEIYSALKEVEALRDTLRHEYQSRKISSHRHC